METREIMGWECVSIGSTKQWLHILLSGQMHKSTYYHAINNFVAECFEAVKSVKRTGVQPGPASPPVPLQDKQDGGAASSQVAKRGRAAIFAAGEDEPED